MARHSSTLWRVFFIMKTNVTLSSESRNLFGVIVRQQTKTGFLNLSDLQQAYEKGRLINGWANRGQITDLLAQKENLERVYYLLKDQGVINTEIPVFIEQVEKQGLIKVLKSLKVYKTTGARHTRTVFCDPYIWVLAAMELNPLLYAKVITWLTDKLILTRIEAGDLYKDLTRATKKFPDVDYPQLAKGLNYCIFGRHESGLRNIATQQQLNELRALESNLAFAVDMGLVPTYPKLIEKMLEIYYAKNRQPRLDELSA